MKLSFTVALALAGTGLAMPTLSTRQFFGDGSPNFASDIFDTAACIVSSFIGGGNPKCRGNGSGSDSSSSSGDKGGAGSGSKGGDGDGAAVPDKDKDSGSGGTKSDTGYSYDFTNNPDGSATYTVKPNRNGKSCKVTLKKEERDNLNAVLGKLAKECN